MTPADLAKHGLRVRELLWTTFRRKYKSFNGEVNRAEAIFGCYEIWHYESRDGDQFHLHYQSKWFPTLEATKTAANADHASRVCAEIEAIDSPSPQA
jgi:hypothetical protein